MDLFDQIKHFLGSNLIGTEEVSFTFGALIALAVALIVCTFVLKYVRKVITARIPKGSKSRFISLFQFFQYVIYIFVVFFTLEISGVNIGVFLTASAAIFIGLGFALQQLFQDLILLIRAARSQNGVSVLDPEVFFTDFGDSALQFTLFFYIDEPFDVQRISSDIRFGIDRLFRENRVTIPFPQRDVHLRETP